jgi:hypothetical protein
LCLPSGFISRGFWFREAWHFAGEATGDEPTGNCLCSIERKEDGEGGEMMGAGMSYLFADGVLLVPESCMKIDENL